MNTPIPHPTQAAVDASAEVLSQAVQASGGVPVEDRVPFRALHALQKHALRSQTLPIVVAAAPAISISAAVALAAQLDEAGMHDAATLINRTVDSWRAAAPESI